MHHFNRGLSPTFLHDLQSGRFAPIMAAAKTHVLDIQIRNNYVDFYARGCAVLQVKEVPRKRTYIGRIHWKYLSGTNDIPPCSRSGAYCLFDATGDFVAAFLNALPKITQNTRLYAKAEATIEEAIVTQSLEPGASMPFIDRQIQVPGVTGRADLLGLLYGGGTARIVITELKQGLDNRIQELIDQVDRYREILAPADGRLDFGIADSYRTVLCQKQQLGLLPLSLQFSEDRPIVETLIILYDYNVKSRLLGRLRNAAKGHALRPYLVTLERGQFALPPRDSWETLT